MGRCKYVPSPGDTGPEGCGLLPENEFPVSFYTKWKAFGPVALQLTHLELTEADGDLLLEKLMVIEQYYPALCEAEQRRRGK